MREREECIKNIYYKTRKYTTGSSSCSKNHVTILSLIIV